MTKSHGSPGACRPSFAALPPVLASTHSPPDTGKLE